VAVDLIREATLRHAQNKTTENCRVGNETMPLIDTAGQLIASLEEQYATRKVHLHTLHQADDKAVYRVQRANGAPWVLRRYPAERAAYCFRPSATSDRNS
jgi:hypothetical protein